MAVKKTQSLVYLWIPHGEKYTNKDGSITKGGLIAGVLNHNLDIYEGETTAIGKYGGYDKNINTKEFQRSFNAFNAMWQMAISQKQMMVLSLCCLIICKIM